MQGKKLIYTGFQTRSLQIAMHAVDTRRGDVSDGISSDTLTRTVPVRKITTRMPRRAKVFSARQATSTELGDALRSE